jgi:ribonuclease HI
MKLEVYSDGSGTTKSTPAGYGYVVCRDDIKVYEGSGHLSFGTNNDAELQGAIEGLDSLNKYFISNDIGLLEEVTLVSDSQIILNWANGTNRFKQLDKIGKYAKLMGLMKQFNAKTRWVHGHNGDEHNERCDKLANAARKQEKI